MAQKVGGRGTGRSVLANRRAVARVLVYDALRAHGPSTLTGLTGRLNPGGARRADHTINDVLGDMVRAGSVVAEQETRVFHATVPAPRAVQYRVWVYRVKGEADAG